MLGKVKQCEHESNAIQGSEGDADSGPGANGVHGRVAGCIVKETAIRVDVSRLVRGKSQETIAIRAVVQRIIGV